LCRQRKRYSVGAARSALPQDDFRRRSAHDELAAHSITSSARVLSPSSNLITDSWLK